MTRTAPNITTPVIGAPVIGGPAIGAPAIGVPVPRTKEPNGRRSPQPTIRAGTFNPADTSWEQIVVDHHAFVLSRARWLTRNQHDAEDLTSDVFVRVFGALHTYVPGGSFRGWLARITTNLYIDQVRRRNRIRFDPLLESQERNLHSSEPDPADAVAASMLEPRLQQALDDLPAMFREVIVLRDLHGLTYEQVAGQLGVKQATVRTRIHRGRARLRAVLTLPGSTPPLPSGVASTAA